MTSLSVEVPTPAPLTVDALEAAVRQGESCAHFVPAWVLQKIVAADRRLGAPSSGSRIRAYVIPRARLLEIVAQQELPLADIPGEHAPSIVLLTRPDADDVSNTPPAHLLLSFWRLLFHARISAAASASLESSNTPDSTVQLRIQSMGRNIFNEARFVLQRERYVSIAADDAVVYAEFAAVYLDLTHFAPRPLAAFFPAIDDHAAIVELLNIDIPSAAILASTRPPGAPDLVSAQSSTDPQSTEIVIPPTHLDARARKDASRVDRLLQLAAHNDTVGNDVRAGIYRMRAYRTGKGDSAAIYAASRIDLDDIVRRLSAALNLSDADARACRDNLSQLLDNAAGGWWNAEGRLLYDLQKVCVFHEREIYSINVVDYCLERGRRPLKRPQPAQRLVLMIKALRLASSRLDRARIPASTRSQLCDLLDRATDSVADRIRDLIRPGICSALEYGELRPRSVTEHVALDKLTEELADRLIENGYLRFSDVRDGISKNEIKLDDLKGPGEFIKGDQLLRIDRKLEDNLDYVYHRGEAYLRSFHRLSSAFFATRVGRAITKLAILPAGGAFLILEALDHTVGKLLLRAQYGKTAAVKGLAAAAESLAPTPTATAVKAVEEHQAVFAQWWMILTLAIFLVGVINIPPFRRAVAKGFKFLGRFLHSIFIDAPRWVLTRPLIYAVIHSRAMRVIGQYTLKPAAFAAVVWLFVPDTAPVDYQIIIPTIAFVVVALILGSPAGRIIEQEIRHALRTTLARYGIEIFVVAARAIFRFFERIFEAIDRLLYAVDELLRFRAGQSKAAVVAKAILGVFWFYIAYLTRFILNLLVEPQINPIKHFPVVTVSHKLLFPTYIPLSRFFQALGFHQAQALTYATGVIWCIPGIFGFLAWEFKENWKLYRANRSKHLKPVRVGSHGESIAQFLRPGFHSGTIPKAFAKLRKSLARQSDPSDHHAADSSKAIAASHHVLHHVEQSLSAFIEREILALINRHPLFGQSPIHLHHLHLATTQIEFTLTTSPFSRLACEPCLESPPLETSPPSPNPSPTLHLTLEQRAGWILASIPADTLTPHLSPEQSSLLSAALLGFYKLSAVDLVSQQIQSLFKIPPSHFDLRRNDLILWPANDFSTQIIHPLTDVSNNDPSATATQSPMTDNLFLKSTPLSRDTWNNLWESKPLPQK